MSRGELNRESDDVSASGGGAGAAHKNPEAEVLGAFAGSKNDGDEFVTEQSFLAAKRRKNDGAEFAGTEQQFLASQGTKNEGAGAGAEAEAEAVLGAFSGSNTLKAAASAGVFFEAAPAVPHSANLTEKGVEKSQRTEKAPELEKAEIALAGAEQEAPQYEHMNGANMNDTITAASKGWNTDSRKSEAVTILHPLCTSARLELFETNKIQDVNSIKNWLLQKELESDENYFMRLGTDKEKKLWQRVRACPNVFDQKFPRRALTPVKMATNKTGILFLHQQMRRSGSTVNIREIAHLSMHGLSEITNFLCRNYLVRNEKAERLALDMLCEAVRDIANAQSIGCCLPGLIATVVLYSYLGSAESQRLSLQILILLSRRYQNKLKIISFGGFSSALHHASQQHAMMGCRLMASLMDTDEGRMKFIKDGASDELVNLTVKIGHLTPWISGVIEGLRDFPLGRTKFMEAVASLPTKEVFVQQRLTWCLIDFVEEDERYRHYDTLED